MKLVVLTVIATLLIKRVFCLLCSSAKYLSNFRANITLSLFNLMVWLPCGRRYLQKEQTKAQADFDNRIRSKRKNQVHKLPEVAWRPETIMNRIRQGKMEAD